MKRCEVRDEDLIAYEDGYLTGGRLELVQAHVKVRCPSCEGRLSTFREVDSIIRANAPPVDALDVLRGQQELRRRLRAVRPEPPLKRIMRPLAIVFGLALLGVTVWPAASDADSRLGDFVRFGEIQARRIPGVPNEGAALKHVATAPAGITLSFDGIELVNLPENLIQVERSTPNPDRLELLYKNNEGLGILVAQTPTQPDVVKVSPTGDYFVVEIAGVSVLALPDPWPNTVSAMFWEHDGIVFAFIVTESWGGLLLDAATPIVAALIEAQEGTSIDDE